MEGGGKCFATYATCLGTTAYYLRSCINIKSSLCASYVRSKEWSVLHWSHASSSFHTEYVRLKKWSMLHGFHAK